MIDTQLKNSLTPYEEQGKWYKFFIESDGTAYTVTFQPPELYFDVSVSGSYLKLENGIHIIDQKFDIHVDTAAAATFEQGLHLYADGSQAVVLPDVSTFDYLTLWIFVYREPED